jgi:hypothetical protein
MCTKSLSMKNMQMKTKPASSASIYHVATHTMFLSEFWTEGDDARRDVASSSLLLFFHLPYARAGLSSGIICCAGLLGDFMYEITLDYNWWIFGQLSDRLSFLLEALWLYLVTYSLTCSPSSTPVEYFPHNAGTKLIVRTYAWRDLGV